MPVEQLNKSQSPGHSRSSKSSVAHEKSRAVLEALFGPPAERDFDVYFWDDQVDRGQGGDDFTLVLNSRHALRRMLVPPSELSIAESIIRGDVDILGNLEAAAGIGDQIGYRMGSRKAIANLARLVMALPRDRKDNLSDRRFSEADRALGRQHDPDRDARAIQFHYDIGNAFYQLWLDKRMVYSCVFRGLEQHLW